MTALFFLLFFFVVPLWSKPSIVVINPYTYQVTTNPSAQGFLLLRFNGVLSINDYNDPNFVAFDTTVAQELTNATLTPVNITTVTGPVYNFDNNVIIIPSNFSTTCSELNIATSVLQITNQCTFTSAVSGSFISSLTFKKLPNATYSAIVGNINFEHPNILRPIKTYSGVICVGCVVTVKLNLNAAQQAIIFSLLQANFPDGTFITRLPQGYISWNDTITCTNAMVINENRLSVDNIDSEFTAAVTGINPLVSIVPAN